MLIHDSNQGNVLSTFCDWVLLTCINGITAQFQALPDASFVSSLGGSISMCSLVMLSLLRCWRRCGHSAPRILSILLVVSCFIYVGNPYRPSGSTTTLEQHTPILAGAQAKVEDTGTSKSYSVATMAIAYGLLRSRPLRTSS